MNELTADEFILLTQVLGPRRVRDIAACVTACHDIPEESLIQAAQSGLIVVNGAPGAQDQLRERIRLREPRLAEAVRLLRCLVEDTTWVSRETSEWANGCTACSGIDGQHDDDCALLEARAFLDSLHDAAPPDDERGREGGRV